MTDDLDESEDDVVDIWTGPAEFGHLVGPKDLEGIPVEGLMTLREVYDETPEDPIDRAVAVLCDLGIGMVFDAIGLVGHPAAGFFIDRPASVQSKLARRRFAELADLCYRLARCLASRGVPPAGWREELAAAADHAQALTEEHLVVNEGSCLATLDDACADTDPDEVPQWWCDLGWASYEEWRAHHRDMAMW